MGWNNFAYLLAKLYKEKSNKFVIDQDHYTCGWESFFIRKKREENPNAADTKAHIEWDLGFSTAELAQQHCLNVD